MARCIDAIDLLVQVVVGPGTFDRQGAHVVRSKRLPRMKSSAPDAGVGASGVIAERQRPDRVE